MLCCKVSICLLDHFVPCLPSLPPGIPAKGGAISRRTTEQSTGESVFIHRLLERCTRFIHKHRRTRGARDVITKFPRKAQSLHRNSNEQIDYWKAKIIIRSSWSGIRVVYYIMRRILLYKLWPRGLIISLHIKKASYMVIV